MKKRGIITGIAVVLATAMITACGGSSKKDYIADVKALSEFTQAVTAMQDMEDYAEAAEDLKMSTKEGKAIQKDMEELGSLLNDFSDLMKDLENYDEEKAAKIEEDMTTLQKKTEKDAEAFEKAARKSGVTDKELEDLDLGL